MRDRVRLQHFASVRDSGLELVHQARLARARLANRRNDLSVSSPGLLQRAGHRRHLALASDEPRQPAPRRQLEVTAQRPGAYHLVHVDRLAQTFDLRSAQVAEGEISLAQSLRRLTGRDRTRGRRRLHPRRQIGHMTDWRVFGMPSGFDRPHHHLARVHPDPRFDGNLALRAQTVSVATQLLLHRQRRMKCALRMVLVRNRRAEQSENAVAGRLRDVAAVAMHRRHHKLQHRVDDRARLFGIEIAHQLGRALDIGEQRGDRLALALERVAGRLLRRDTKIGSGRRSLR